MEPVVGWESSIFDTGPDGGGEECCSSPDVDNGPDSGGVGGPGVGGDAERERRWLEEEDDDGGVAGIWRAALVVPRFVRALGVLFSLQKGVVWKPPAGDVWREKGGVRWIDLAGRRRIRIWAARRSSGVSPLSLLHPAKLCYSGWVFCERSVASRRLG